MDNVTQLPDSTSGDGLLTTGTQLPILVYMGANYYVFQQDLELIFGACYQPQVFQGDPDSFMTTTGYMVQPDGKYGWNPYFAKSQDAVDWLKKNRYYGQVQKYVHTNPLNDRGRKRTVVGRDEFVEGPYRPWLTAGITDIVNAESTREAHVQILTAAKGLTIHDRNGNSEFVSL